MSHPVTFSPTDSKVLAVGAARLKDGKATGAIELWRLDDLLADKTGNTPGRESAPPSSGASDQTAPAGKQQKDQEHLAGAWRLVGFEVKGKEISPEQVKAVGIRWAIKGDKATETARGKTREMTFRLDATQKPKRMELTVVAGEGGQLFPGGTDKGQKLPGIYLLNQDELTICMDTEGKDFPPEFATKEDNLWVRYTLKRDKAAKDAKTPEDKESALDLQGELNVGRSNLRQIGLALAAYEDAKGRLPAAAIYSKDGKPILSWRVAILPYLLADDGDLLNQFKLDEPWDSAHNKQLLAKMPSFYASPAVKPKEPHSTFIQVFAGKGTAFEGPEGKKAADIKDLANKLLVVEAGEAVPWTKPQDLPYDAAKPLPNLGGSFRTGFHFLIGFSNVHFTKKKIFEEDQLRREIEIDR